MLFQILKGKSPWKKERSSVGTFAGLEWTSVWGCGALPVPSQFLPVMQNKGHHGLRHRPLSSNDTCGQGSPLHCSPNLPGPGQESKVAQRSRWKWPDHHAQVCKEHWQHSPPVPATGSRLLTALPAAGLALAFAAPWWGRPAAAARR